MHQRSQYFLCLLIVLLIAALVRLWGVRHGEPKYIFHPDAGRLAKAAGQTYEGSFNPQLRFGKNWAFAAYPYGNAIMCGQGLRALDRLSNMHRPDVTGDAVSGWYWMLQLRYFSIGCYLVALALVLWVQRDRLSGVWLFMMGIALAVEPLNSQLSHYGMNDVPMVALLMAAWAASTRMPDEPSKLPWASALTGLCLGLGFGVKYQAALGAIFPAGIWLVCTRKRGGAWFACSLAALIAAGAGAALWTCPIIRDPAYFMEVMPPFLKWQSSIVARTDGFWAKIMDNTLSLGRDTLRTGHWLLLPALVLPWLPRLRKPDAYAARELLPAALFCIVLSVAVIAGRTLPRVVDLLPVIPFCIIILANLLCPSPSRAAARPRWATCLACITVVWFGAVTFLDSAALAQTDTRLKARAWCRAHLKPGHIVFREHYTVASDVDGVHEQNVGTLSTAVKKGRILQNAFDYAVASSLSYERFFDAWSPYYYPKYKQFYEHLFENYPLVAEFQARKLIYANPHIRIYGRQPDAPPMHEVLPATD